MALHVDREALRSVRRSRGLSVPDLAKELDVSPMHLYRLEWGVRNPSPDLLASLAQFYGLDPTKLLDGARWDHDLVVVVFRILNAPEPDSWTCPNCGGSSDTAFCGNCGTAQPVTSDHTQAAPEAA